MEVWKPIRSLLGLYEASSLGNIRSVRRLVGKQSYGGKVLKAGFNPTNGYLSVGPSINNKVSRHYVHRLVAEAFLGLEKKKDVNHKDGNKKNNRIENLEWMTRSENQLHANAFLPRKAQPSSMTVCLVKGKEKLTFPNQTKAGKFLGVTAGSISSAAKRNHKCKGYGVKYV